MLERELQERLRGESFEQVEIASHLHGDRPGGSLADLVPSVAAAGYHLLVGVDVVRLGERELDYFGMQERLFENRLDLRVFLLPTPQPSGAGWSEEIGYTAMTAAVQAEQSFSDVTVELARTLRTLWKDYARPRSAPR